MHAAREWLCMWIDISIARSKTHVGTPTVAKAHLTISGLYSCNNSVAVGVAQVARYLLKSIVGYGMWL